MRNPRNSIRADRQRRLARLLLYETIRFTAEHLIRRRGNRASCLMVLKCTAHSVGPAQRGVKRQQRTAILLDSLSNVPRHPFLERFGLFPLAKSFVAFERSKDLFEDDNVLRCRRYCDSQSRRFLATIDSDNHRCSDRVSARVVQPAQSSLWDKAREPSRWERTTGRAGASGQRTPSRSRPCVRCAHIAGARQPAARVVPVYRPAFPCRRAAKDASTGRNDPDRSSSTPHR